MWSGFAPYVDVQFVKHDQKHTCSSQFAQTTALHKLGGKQKQQLCDN